MDKIFLPLNIRQKPTYNTYITNVVLNCKFLFCFVLLVTEKDDFTLEKRRSKDLILKVIKDRLVLFILALS